MTGQQEPEGLEAFADRLAALIGTSETMVVGLTGSVASGKTTLAGHLTDALSPRTVEAVSTDGFLFPNAVLEARELINRKGFPETYDRAAMAAALRNVRAGTANFPAYSHEIFDTDPSLACEITQPDVLILEGLGFQPPSSPDRHSGEPDVLIYLDAEQAHVERWFLERFMRFWRAAEHDPASFYARFRHMSEPETETFAMKVWREINLPNLENHIAPLREHADIVLMKDADHGIRIVEDRMA